MKQEEIQHLSTDKTEVKALSELSPARSISAITGEWLIIIVAIMLSSRFPNPVLFLMAWILIGSRMYALYSLLHDGIHFLLVPDRRVNDWICRLLLAWPLFIDFSRIRKGHLAHHRELQTPEDPEWMHLNYREFQFPRSKNETLVTFLMDISGINFIKYKLGQWGKLLYGGKRTDTQPERAHDTKYIWIKALYYGAGLTAIVYMGWYVPFLLYWLLPYMTIYQTLNRLRLSTEHFHLDRLSAYRTRTVKLNWLERFFLSPHHLGYHTEHHIYPHIPFYRLPILHRMLMNDETYRKEVIVNKSYIEVIPKYIN